MGPWSADEPSDAAVCFLKTSAAILRKLPEDVGRTAGTCASAERSPPPALPLTLLAGRFRRVLLTGPTANSLVYQSGGWSVRWQGACADSDFEAGGETLRGALQRLLPREVALVHTRGCAIAAASSHATAVCNIDPVDLNATLAATASVDVAVVALGGENYTEKPGDIDELALHEGQLSLVRKLAAAAPNLKIVLVLIEGRPRLLRGLAQLPNVVGVVHAYVPGPHGGRCERRATAHAHLRTPLALPEARPAPRSYDARVGAEPPAARPPLGWLFAARSRRCCSA
jgi:hypothetical protein